MLWKINANSLKLILKICPKNLFLRKISLLVSFHLKVDRDCFLLLKESSLFQMQPDIVLKPRGHVTIKVSSPKRETSLVRLSLRAEKHSPEWEVVLSFFVLFVVSRFSKRDCSFGLNINIAAVARAVRFGGTQQLTSRISMSSSGLNRLCGEISLHLIWRTLYNISPCHFLSIIALLIINLLLTKGLEVMIMFERDRLVGWM